VNAQELCLIACRSGPALPADLHRLFLKALCSPNREDNAPRTNIRGPRRVLRRQFQTQRVILPFFPMRTTRYEPQGEGSRQARWTGRHFDPLMAARTTAGFGSLKLDLADVGSLRSSIPAFHTH
jgi:hypothetical protein